MSATENKKRTFEAQSTAKRRRELGMLRSMEKEKKRGYELYPQRLGCDSVHTNWETIVILGAWSIRWNTERCEE